MTVNLDTILLLALPASGKSEVRKYLEGLSPAQCREELHLGPTVQLDDFPYVHLMQRIDAELVGLGQPRMFFHGPDKPFQDPRDWQVLIELLNEDYANLFGLPMQAWSACAQALFQRFDGARARIGAPPLLGTLPKDTRRQLEIRLEKESAALHTNLRAARPGTLDGKTLVIEFARGGADGSAMPLPPPFGYASSIPLLAPAILERACVLYIWVTPEESRRKNQARTDPNDPGSILHHGVPLEVMLHDYGCDDIEHMVATSGRPDTLRVAAYGRDYYLPVARIDNRTDKTSFIRKPRDQWVPAEVDALHAELAAGFARLHRQNQHR
ncbi:MAG: hypothetical protein AB7O24_11155 [Kofleriaceae bacterium]